ncbi:MAG: hypothetical protein Q9187_007129 [Circinaria calcarea]
MAPLGFLKHLKGYYSKTEDLPVLSTRSAAGLSIIFTLLYVLPFYLSPITRPSPTLSRDAPSVIRARIRFVTIACAISTLVTIRTISIYARVPLTEIFRLLGWYPISIFDIARCLLLTALLFLGPLFEKGIVEGGWREWIRGRALYNSLSNWIGWRNYIAGPITEEHIFRSLLIPLHLLTSLTPTHILFLTPLYFGIAHIHHFYEFHLTHPRTPLLPALLRSLFQFTYTTLFGWYASFLFLRTRSLWAVVLVHAFCNWCGLPRVWGKVEAGEMIGPIGRGKGSGRANEATVQVADGRLGIGWTVAYYVLLVAGAVAFRLGLWVLTDSARKLASLGV